MGLIEKTKIGIRSLKWIVSKKGREYISEQKADRKGIKHICDHHNGDCKDHEYKKPCEVPPEGWSCTRKKGHDGPCAAVPERDEK